MACETALAQDSARLALGLECLQICHDIRDLIRIEPELRHRRMVDNNAFGLRCNVRNGGAMASGLSLTLSMAWHCAQ